MPRKQADVAKSLLNKGFQAGGGDHNYPKSGKRGRPPIGLERMLRMYLRSSSGMAWPMKR